jgi:hypothetical protein
MTHDDRPARSSGPGLLPSRYAPGDPGLKVMAQEVTGFGVAFAVSLAVSVAIVELIWGLI